jgi:hypothetical protein
VHKTTDVPEKGVTQDNIVQVVHLRVVDDIPINEEKDGQVDLLTGSDSLLLEAETFDFGKVRGDLLVSLGTDIARRLAGKEAGRQPVALKGLPRDCKTSKS